MHICLHPDTVPSKKCTDGVDMHMATEQTVNIAIWLLNNQTREYDKGVNTTTEF